MRSTRTTTSSGRAVTAVASSATARAASRTSSSAAASSAAGRDLQSFPAMAEKYARVSDPIKLAYDEIGDPADPPLLLVHGLGAQMIAWREEFLQMLAHRGLRVIRFDNRDIGLSTHLEGMPDLRAMLAGDMSSALYSLGDMATDTLGLLDHLEIDSAHVVGVSM